MAEAFCRSETTPDVAKFAVNILTEIIAATLAYIAEFESATNADFNKLVELNLGSYPERGEPIDPSEDGPLGTLWPAGPPRWYDAA